MPYGNHHKAAQVGVDCVLDGLGGAAGAIGLAMRCNTNRHVLRTVVVFGEQRLCSANGVVFVCSANRDVFGEQGREPSAERLATSMGDPWWPHRKVQEKRTPPDGGLRPEINSEEGSVSDESHIASACRCAAVRRCSYPACRVRSACDAGPGLAHVRAPGSSSSNRSLVESERSRRPWQTSLISGSGQLSFEESRSGTEASRSSTASRGPRS